MASSVSQFVVKAGYWFFGRDLNRRVADIPSELFTHLYAGFANVDGDGRVSPEVSYVQQFKDFTKTVKVRNPTVKTLLSIGGEGADLSEVVANSDKRRNLITDSIELARNFGFDGLDLCWLYPSNAGLENPFASLLSEWRDDINAEAARTQSPSKLLLTAAVFHHPVSPGADGHNAFRYPIQAINEKLDRINVLAIDFYTPSNSRTVTGPVHAWNTRPMDQLNRCGSVGIQKWIESRVVTNKLVLGLPFYGYQWTRDNRNAISGFFAKAHPANTEPVLPMAYRDIQDELRRGNYQTVYDSNFEAVYSCKISEENWIGYDDGLCIFGKVRKAIDAGLGGYFAWCVGTDDVNWTLSRSAFESAPPPAWG